MTTVSNLSELEYLVNNVRQLQTTDVNVEFQIEENTLEEGLIDGYMTINYGEVSLVCYGCDIFTATSRFYVPTSEVENIIAEWNS